MGNKHAKKKPLQPDLAEWRGKDDWCKKAEMLDHVKKYQPQNSSIKHVRILLHGPVGAGKSSFVNSVNNIFQGRMTHLAHVATLGGESYTLNYQTHEIQKDAQHFYPLVFNDIMGLEAERGIQEEDIKLIMKGHVKDGYLFNPVSAMPNTDLLYNHHPTMDDRIHVLVSVVPADNVNIMDQDVISKIKRIRRTASDLGIPQICIITKIDELHPAMKNDVRIVYKLQKVKDKMEAFSNEVGIPVNCIFPVKNYHEEIDLNDDVDVLILKALKQIIDFGEDFINVVMKADPK